MQHSEEMGHPQFLVLLSGRWDGHGDVHRCGLARCLAAVKQARGLIDEGTVDTETGWGEAAPTAAEGNKEIERKGYDGYGRWHLVPCQATFARSTMRRSRSS